MIADQLRVLKQSLPEGVKLVAVSKTRTNDEILEAYHAGQRIFGENKVQEMVRKWEMLPKDIEWHFIGHLQTNKVRDIAPFVAMIHAVDSLKLLSTIQVEAARCNRKIPCLLQFHVAQEESKFGFLPSGLAALFQSIHSAPLDHVTLSGVMGMATFTERTELIHQEFALLNKLFYQIRDEYLNRDSNFKELSMGMSNDYLIALEHGSTLVRIGSTLFGERVY